MLCGHPPFRGTKEKEIKEKILKGEFDFSEKEWKKVSNEAKVFVKQLLTQNAVERISAEQALNNDWLINIMKSDEKDRILDDGIISNLMHFSSNLALQKAALAYIANQTAEIEDIKRIKSEFDKIDENNDGVLTKDELINCKFLN